MNKRQRQYWLPRIADKQGGFFCNHCGADPKSLKKNGKDSTMLIDHINNIAGDDRLDNFQLLCRGCNKRKNPSRHGLPRLVKTQSEKTNEKEDLWRAWVITQIRKIGPVTLDYAIYSGAEIFKISPDTIERRWLKKIVSAVGPLTDIEVDKFGNPVLTFRSRESVDIQTTDTIIPEIEGV